MSDDSYNRPLGIARLIALWLLVGVLVVLAKPTPLGVTLGFAIAALGEAVRFWAAGHLLKTKELITSGPYRYTRNPLYFGRLLIFTGLCIMAQMPWGVNWAVLLLGYAIFFGYYMPRKERVEPARLKAEHGAAFERYFAAVPALFPTLRPYDQPSAGGWSSDRMLRNREHWMVVGILVIAGVLLVKAYRVPPPAPEEQAPVETSWASPGR